MSGIDTTGIPAKHLLVPHTGRLCLIACFQLAILSRFGPFLGSALLSSLILFLFIAFSFALAAAVSLAPGVTPSRFLVHVCLGYIDEH